MSNKEEAVSVVPIYHTDRSSIVQAARCPRARFWNKEFSCEGVEFGIEGNGLSLPLVIGSAVHAGLDVLHRAHLRGNTIPVEGMDLVLSTAVRSALTLFNSAVAKAEAELNSAKDIATDEMSFFDRPVELEGENTSEKLKYKIQEGRVLVEGLVRAYEKVGLPLLLNEFNILHVEEEMSMLLNDEDAEAEFHIQLNGRADAILQHKDTKDLVVLSIKTAKELDYRSAKNWAEDDQGISECMLVRKMVEDGRLAEFGYQPGTEYNIGVMMLWLFKGREWKNESTGVYESRSPLAMPYASEQPVGYLLNPKSYYYVDGVQKKLNYKTWKATPLWKLDVTVEDWIEQLYSEWHDVLSAQVQFSEVHIRTAAEMNNWVMEAFMQEAGFAAAKLKAGNYYEMPNEIVFATVYRKVRSACNYPYPCQFKLLCHPVSTTLGMSDVAADVLYRGLVQVEGFKERIPNHPAEGRRNG